jgi:hypothetical protein
LELYGLERLEEAGRLILGERNPSLVGEHVSCPVGRGSAEEVAQRFADRGGGRLVDGPLLLGESKFKSLSTHAHGVRTPYGIPVMGTSDRLASHAVRTCQAPGSSGPLVTSLDELIAGGPR